jgi:allantoicase
MTNKVHKWVQLERPRLGTRVTYATDEFFGAKERLIDPADPVFIDDKYDDHGKWMDGWESRRKREPGHDYCVIRLGVPGVIHGFDVDTSYFTGNYPPQASIEACVSKEDAPEDGWVELIPKTDLAGDSHHFLDARNDTIFTHVRLHIYPDGGVARLRVFGEVKADFTGVDGYVDGRGVNMGDGWETARRRGPGNDWVIIALGEAGVIERAEIDTAHFKGNYPDRVSLEAAMFDSDDDAGIDSPKWQTLLPVAKLKMDQQHYFDDSLEEIGPVSHVRMSIYPDGGVSRIRLFGRVHG